jgi:hypothetical protein
MLTTTSEAPTTVPVPRDPDLLRRLYRAMVLIRNFEEKIDALRTSGQLQGSAHLCVGPEAVATGVCAQLNPDDRSISVLRWRPTMGSSCRSFEMHNRWNLPCWRRQPHFWRSERAQANQLASADLQGGSFTVTSLVPFGVDFFTPIINPPQVAILGIGRMFSNVVLEREKAGERQAMTLSLSFDHQAVDGARGSRLDTREALDFTTRS